MITAVIPARNEEHTIELICREVSKYVDELIVVVNNADEATIRNIPSNAKVVFENRRGKGIAMRAGVNSARGDIIVFIDADLSHDPREIGTIVKPIQDDRADHVVASRMLGGSSELFYTVSQFVRLCGSHVITLLINHKFKSNLTDSQNGFRAIKKDVFVKIDLQEKHTTIEQEMTVKTLSSSYRLLELPAHEYCRAAGNSKINVAKHGWRYIGILIVFLFRRKPSGWKHIDMSLTAKLYNKPWFAKDN